MSWRNQILASNQVRWSIVGPNGTGKSVLLQDIADGMEHAEYHKIYDSYTIRQRWGVAKKLFLRSTVPLFIDSAELLPQFLFTFPSLLRKKLVITLHHEKQAFAVLHRTQFEFSVALEIFEKLTGKKPTDHERNQLQRLSRETNGNMREVLRQLYHDCAKQ